MKTVVSTLALPLILAALQTSANAEQQTVSASAQQNQSLTISPLHLAFSSLEVTYETRVAKSFSLAGIASFGGPGYEGGMQLRNYFIGGDIAGLHAGLEASYGSYEAEDDEVSVQADGLALGSFLGYKWVGESGITLEAQAGIRRLVVFAEATDGETTSTAGTSEWLPLVNLNMGWSF